MTMKNDFNYKWSKLFASKRYNTKDGVIKLTPEEQQELLDDSERVVKKYSTLDVNGNFTADVVKEAYNDGYEDSKLGFRDFKISNYR